MIEAHQQVTDEFNDLRARVDRYTAQLHELISGPQAQVAELTSIDIEDTKTVELLRYQIKRRSGFLDTLPVVPL